MRGGNRFGFAALWVTVGVLLALGVPAAIGEVQDWRRRGEIGTAETECLGASVAVLTGSRGEGPAQLFWVSLVIVDDDRRRRKVGWGARRAREDLAISDGAEGRVSTGFTWLGDSDDVALDEEMAVRPEGSREQCSIEIHFDP